MTRIRKIKSVLICVICVPVFVGAQVRANTVTTASLRDEVNAFLGKELTAHLAAIKSLDPPPDRILGVPTTVITRGARLLRSLAAYAETTGNRELAGRDLAKTVGQIGLIESRAGSKAFSQLLCGARATSLRAGFENQSALAEPLAGRTEGVALFAEPRTLLRS